jgi:hypothetical protein
VLQARFPVRNGPLPLADVRRRPGRPAARHGFAVMSRSASATLGTAGPQDGQWPSRAAMSTPTGLSAWRMVSGMGGEAGCRLVLPAGQRRGALP